MTVIRNGRRGGAAQSWMKRIALVMVGASLVGGSAWLYVAMKAGDVFQATEVTVAGNERLSRDEVLESSGIAESTGLFTIDPQVAVRALLTHPWIRTAQVRRVLPSRIEIVLTERTPVALFMNAGRTKLVDDEGNAFIDRPHGIWTDGTGGLIRIVSDGQDDHEIQHSATKRMILEAIALGRDVRRILRQSHDEYEIHLHPVVGPRIRFSSLEEPNRFEVRIGRGRWEEKLNRLKLIAEQAHREKRRLELVILDNERYPDRVVVRFAASG